jgi:hypothetical protein
MRQASTNWESPRDYLLLPTEASHPWNGADVPAGLNRYPVVSHGFWYCNLTISVITVHRKLLCEKNFGFGSDLD